MCQGGTDTEKEIVTAHRYVVLDYQPLPDLQGWTRPSSHDRYIANCPRRRLLPGRRNLRTSIIRLTENGNSAVVDRGGQTMFQRFAWTSADRRRSMHGEQFRLVKLRRALLQ